MKKLLVLSMALILGVFVGFALKPVPVVTKATNTVTTVGKKTTVSKTNVGTTANTATTLSKAGTQGEILDGENTPPPPLVTPGGKTSVPTVGVKPTTTPGKTTNTGTSKVSLPGNSKVIPSTTVAKDLSIDKGDIKGGTNPVADDSNTKESVTFSIADYMPSVGGSKTQVTNPVSGTLKTSKAAGTEVKTTEATMKR